MPLQNIVLIANPNAGRRNSGNFEAALELLRKHLPVELLFTARPGHATEIARIRGGNPDTLVAVCGGDGTIFEALNGLPPEGVLGILPGGTANVIARELGISLNLREAAKTLLSGAIKAIDTGEVVWQSNGLTKRSARFLMVAGFGFDAFVASKVSRFPKKMLGQFSYHLEVLRRFGWYKPPLIRVETEESETGSVPSAPVALKAGSAPDTGVFLLLANMRRYGGGLFFAEDARYDDGLLNMVLFRDLSRHTLVRSAWEALQHRGVPSTLAHRKCGRAFNLSFDVPTPFQLDGEVFEPIAQALVQARKADVKVILP